MTIAEHTEEILKEYRLNRRDSAITFIKMARRFAAIPGITNHRAVELAQSTFAGSYADYVRRQNLGEKLPSLFPREGASYETQRAEAVSRGNVIR